MKRHFLATIFASSALSALAAQPPGHPSPQITAEMLAPAKVTNPALLPNEGRVLNVLQAGEYTYLEVSNGNAARWLAAPKTEISSGSTVRYEEGSTMASFQSRLLKRSFSNLMFIGQVAVISSK